MELILINDSKLKIMLTEKDMELYDLDCSSADYDNTETRRAFWNILDEAKHRTGFDAASDRVFIQLYPSKQGGCEMYVTKIGLLNDEKEQKYICKKENGQQKISPKHHKTLSFVFESPGELLIVCRLLKKAANKIDSEVWVDELGMCYMFLSTSIENKMPYLYGLLNEFGRSTETGNISAYIKEHGKILCKTKAIETLSVF